MLSQASTHGHSQLKHQNSRVGSYTEKVLKWFNYPRARVHPGWEVSCHGTKSTCIAGSSVLHWGQPDSGESCIVLQSGPTRSLIAEFPHVKLSLEYTNFVLQWKNAANEATNGCMRTFDAWCRGAQSASEQSQLRELSGPTFIFTTQEFSIVGGYTENLEKRQNCQNWGEGTCAGMGAYSGRQYIASYLGTNREGVSGLYSLCMCITGVMIYHRGQAWASSNLSLHKAGFVTHKYISRYHISQQPGQLMSMWLYMHELYCIYMSWISDVISAAYAWPLPEATPPLLWSNFVLPAGNLPSRVSCHVYLVVSTLGNWCFTQAISLQASPMHGAWSS